LKQISGQWAWSCQIKIAKQNRLVLLGTKGGPAVRSVTAMPTSSILVMDGKTIIVDCGIGVTRSIVASGVSLLDINAIFITHLHSDHVLELGPLLHTIWTSGLKRSVDVYGPQGIKEYLEAFLQSMQFDNQIRVEDEGRIPLEELINLTIYSEGFVTRLKSIDVHALKVNHPPVEECYALSFYNESEKVVFSADTAYFEPLASFASECDILVHEVMLMEGVEALLKRTPNASRLREHLLASHSTVEEACKIATMAKAKHLVFNHLIPADDPDISDEDFLAEGKNGFSGQLTVGYDGIEITF
jgi:ribonuclease BN (tRNA processing enzyme)